MSTATATRRKRRSIKEKPEAFFQVVAIAPDGTQKIVDACTDYIGAWVSVNMEFDCQQRKPMTQRSKVIAVELLPVFQVKPGGRVINRKAAKSAETRLERDCSAYMA